jgi:hypothetical protein
MFENGLNETESHYEEIKRRGLNSENNFYDAVQNVICCRALSTENEALVSIFGPKRDEVTRC